MKKIIGIMLVMLFLVSSVNAFVLPKKDINPSPEIPIEKHELKSSLKELQKPNYQPKENTNNIITNDNTKEINLDIKNPKIHTSKNIINLRRNGKNFGVLKINKDFIGDEFLCYSDLCLLIKIYEENKRRTIEIEKYE